MFSVGVSLLLNVLLFAELFHNYMRGYSENVRFGILFLVRLPPSLAELFLNVFSVRMATLF